MIESEFSLDCLKIGPKCCAETSVTIYQSTLRTIPEERRPHLHCGRRKPGGTNLKWTAHLNKVTDVDNITDRGVCHCLMQVLKLFQNYGELDTSV
jgi:hypothetical protein